MSNEVFEEIFARLEARIERLETNINLFTQTGNRMDLTIPAPEPEPEYEVIAEIEGEEFVIDGAGDLTELVSEAESLAAPEIVDVELAELPPADIADEDALADETAVDDSEPTVPAA